MLVAFALVVVVGLFWAGGPYRLDEGPCSHCGRSPEGVKAMDGIEAMLTGTCPHCGKAIADASTEGRAVRAKEGTLKRR